MAYLRWLIGSADMVEVLKEDPEMSDEDVTVEYMLKKLCIIGDKDECLRRLHELYEETGRLGHTAHDRA